MSRGLGDVQKCIVDKLTVTGQWHWIGDLPHNGDRSEYVAVCRAVATLEDRGLVVTKREGRKKYVRLSVDNPVRQSTLDELTTADHGVIIKSGDFRELSNELRTNSVDLVLTDPPYAEEYLGLWRDLGRVAARVLKTGASLVAYCGQYQVLTVGKILENYLRFWWPIVIKHSGQTSRLFGKGVFAEYKHALWFVKNHRRGSCFVSDFVRDSGQDKRYHGWGQGIGAVRYIIEKLSETGDLVLDPFLGGGTTAVACLQTGRRCIGYDIDPEAVAVAQRRVKQAQLTLPMDTEEVEYEQLELTTSGQAASNKRQR